MIVKVVHAAMFLLHILEMVVTPPSRYPDLFPVLNVLVSTPVFGLVWIWSIKRGIEDGWALGGLPGAGTERHPKKDDDNISVADSISSLPSPVRTWREHGRAVSLGFTSGHMVSGRGGHRDPRRRAIERLRGTTVGEVNE